MGHEMAFTVACLPSLCSRDLTLPAAFVARQRDATMNATPVKDGVAVLAGEAISVHALGHGEAQHLRSRSTRLTVSPKRRTGSGRSSAPFSRQASARTATSGKSRHARSPHQRISACRMVVVRPGRRSRTARGYRIGTFEMVRRTAARRGSGVEITPL